MFRKIRCSHLVVCLICLLSAVGAVSAQSPAASLSPAVTAAATAERVRFTAPSTVQQMRLEVYNALGVKRFDNEVRGGNVLDWRLQDGQAEPLADGAYLCLVTVKYVSGRLSQKLGALRIEQGQATMQPAEAGQMSAQQAQAIGPVEAQAALTVLGAAERQTATVLTHTGSEGQLIRGNGARSFRLDDFYHGQDEEQMRLSKEGKLVIGVTDPQAKLDVAGTICTREGIVFLDGSDQTTTFVASGRKLSERAPVQRDAQGHASAGQAKNPKADLRLSPNVGKLSIDPARLLRPLLPLARRWGASAESATTASRAQALNKMSIGGNLAVGKDYSNIAAPADGMIVQGNVGIGTTTPRGGLEVNKNWDGQFGALTVTGDKPTIRFSGGALSGDQQWILHQGSSPVGALQIFNGGTTGNFTAPTMSLLPSGNVGIGITNPTDKLSVVAAAGTSVRATNTQGIGVQGEGGFYGVKGFGTGNGHGVVAQVEGSGSGHLMVGYTGFPSAASRFHITNAGTYVGGSDFAEAMPVGDGKENYEPGDVLVVRAGVGAVVEKSRKPNDVHLAGVYSTRPGMLGADKNGTSRVDLEELPVAIIGIVPTKVSTENGRIQVGDLLTTSRTPGYAMKASAILMRGVKVYRTGTILGKALEPLKHGKSVIKVLVTLR